MAKYIAYETSSRARTKRAWMILEEDGSEDGRVVASDLTREDAETIVALLNERAAKEAKS